MTMFRASLVLLGLVAFTLPMQAETIRQVLIDSQENVRIDTWSRSGRSAEGNWSVRKYTLQGGKQQDVDVVEVNNGYLTMTVIPTRGMSIYEVKAEDLRLGWNSPVKEIVHPRHINLASRGGLGWLEGFNEWMVRCGLEFAGHPGKDTVTTNTGDESSMDLTLHGKIGNIPASEVEVIVEDQPVTRIRVRGRVDERVFFGPQLELWTEVSTTVGGHSLRISDTITNRADSDQEFEIIYHANYGSPLLEEGSQLIGAVERVVPMNDHAANSVDTFATYKGPTAGFIEEVYCLYPYADKDCATEIMLHNAAASRGVSMHFQLSQLPYLTLWKNTVSVENGYVTGLEPATNFPYNRGVERKAGRLPVLAGGASRQFDVDVVLHADPKSVGLAKERIAGIQGDRKTTVEREAPAVD